MKIKNFIKVIVLFLVFILMISVTTLEEKSVVALSLDEIIENPDNIHQIALPLHYSEKSNKKKVLDEIRKGYKEENYVDLDENFKDSAGNKYLVLIDANPTLSTTDIGDVDLSRMVNLADVDEFTFSTGAYTYVVAKTRVVGGQAVIDQTSLKIGVVIAGIYSNVQLQVTGLDENVESPQIIFDSQFALESDEEGVYNIVVGMSYTIIAEEIRNYHVTIEGLDASSRVFTANEEDRVINIHYEKMKEADVRFETRLNLNEKVTVGFAGYLTNSDIYKLAVRNRAGVINFKTGYPIEGINPETMIEFKAEDKVTGTTVTDLSTLEAGTYEVTARFHGIKQYCFASETTFTLVVEKATADVAVNSCVLAYDNVLNNGLNKEDLISITSNTLKENDVDHVYFVAGIDTNNRDIVADVDFTHILSHPNAMVQGEIDKQLLLITEEHDPEGDGLTVSEFYSYVEDLCQLANIKGINFENERLNEIVNKLDSLADSANVKIKIVLNGERDITPSTYGIYVVGALVTDMSYNHSFDLGVVTISPEMAKVEFEGNDLSGIQIQNHTGTPNPLKAMAYDLNGNVLDGTMSYLYVGKNLKGENYISNIAPTDNGAYIVIAKFSNATKDHLATHIGIGLNVLLIGDFEEGKDDLEDAYTKFEALIELSHLMKVFNSVEGFDYNLFTLLGMFEEDQLNNMFERVVNYINSNDSISSALEFANHTLGIDSVERIKDVITRVYPEVVERTVDVHFDSEELNVYKYVGSQIALTATAYDESGNELNGVMKYFYTGYQANGQVYVSPYAPTLPGVYVVNAVYFDLSNGIKSYDYGQASKAFTITTDEISFSLNGEELNDIELEYDGAPQDLKAVAKYSDGNLAKGGTLRVVYVDNEGNASFDAPTLPGEYTAVVFYTERDELSVKYFGYKIINLTIVNQKALVDDTDATDCYNGEEHFKEAILTEGFNNVTVVVDSKNNVSVYVSEAWLSETLTGNVDEVKAQLLEKLKSIHKDPLYISLYTKLESLLNSLTINSLEVNGKKLIEKDTYKVYVLGYKEYYEVVDIQYTHKIVDHNLVASKIVNPTCDTKGYTLYNCLTCGESFERDYVDAHGHIYANPVFNWNGSDCKTATFTCVYDENHTTTVTTVVEKVIITDATCTEKGSYTFVATAIMDGQDYVSKHNKTYEIPALGHTYEAVVTAPTCEDEGYTTYTCSVCGDSYIADKVPALGHDYDNGVVTKEPTETEPGVKTFTCSVCGYTYTEVIPATGKHTYEAVVTAPTCTTDGYTTYTCSVCGDSYIADRVPALGHSYEEKVTKEATCTEKGIKTFTCSVCGDTYTEEIAAKGHDYRGVVTAPTCTTDGYTTYTCSVCGDSYIGDEVKATGHHLDVVGVVTKEATCTESGLKINKCADCDYYIETVIPALGHSYDNGVVTKEATCAEPGVKTYTCSVCGDTYTEVIPATNNHDYTDSYIIVAPTCTAQGYTRYICKVCGHEGKTDNYVDALGHDYEITVVKLPTDDNEVGLYNYKCKVCGYSFESGFVIDPEKLIKDPNASKDPTCTEDGYTTYHATVDGNVYTYVEVIPHLTHNYDCTAKTDATCTEDGFETYTCIYCGDTYTNTIPALGHDYKAVVTAPTCTTEGYTKHTCIVCGDSYIDNRVPALGHSSDEGTVTTEPTCKSEGVKTYKCLICGEVIKTETLDKTTNHSYKEEVTKAPTCTELGVKTFTCTICGHTYTENIDSTGHDYKAVVTAPTCEDKGYTTYTCSSCGDSYVADYVDALGHSYEEKVTKEATCTEDGEKTFTCSVCNDTYTEVIPATGHDYKGVVTAPTCTTEGYTTYTCACGDSYIADKVPALGHDYECVTINPTCGESGSNTYTCKVCGHTYKDVIPATGEHSYDAGVVTKAPTETEKGIKTYTCTVCGKKYTEEIPTTSHDHKFDDGVVTKEPTCTVDGEKIFTCPCGETYTKVIPATGHDYKAVVTAPTCTTEGYTTYTCVCGDSYVADRVPALGHSYEEKVTKEATCTEDGEKTFTCSVCNDTYTEVIPATGHDYKGVVTAPTCEDKGYTTYTCSSCGDSYVADYVDALGHDYECVTINPTCGESGSNTYTCKVCGHTYKDVIPATGEHSYDAGVVTKEATCIANGEKTYTCTICNKTKTEEIPATGIHNDRIIDITAPTCTEDGKIIYQCSDCGRKNTVDDENNKATGHSHKEEITTPATCTEKGVKTFTCHCGDTYTEGIPATGHNYKTTSVEATCTSRGYTIYKCQNCNYEYNDNYIDPLGHELETIITPATCTQNGLKTVKCTVCKVVIEETPIAPTGHKHQAVVTAPTCEDKGYTTYTCSACGDSYVTDYVDELGHNWIITEIPATCTEDGKKVGICSRDANHTYEEIITSPGHNMVESTVDATCTEEGYTLHKCSVCDYEYKTNFVPALGHSYGEWEYHKFPTDLEKGQMKQTCTVCKDVNYKDVDAIGQVYNGIVYVNLGTNGIGTIVSEDIEKAIEATKYSGVGAITIVNKNSSTVNSVLIDKEYLDKLLNKDLELAFELNKLSIVFDSAALEAIRDQSNSNGPVSFGFNLIKFNDLNSEQQKAMKNENYVKLMRLEIVSGDALISNFRGGNATVSLPFTPQGGYDISDYKVVHITNDGKIEEIEFEYIENELVMNLTHFSEYGVINSANDDYIIWIVVIVCLVLLLAIVVIIGSIIVIIIIKKEKKQNECIEQENNNNNNSTVEETVEETVDDSNDEIVSEEENNDESLSVVSPNIVVPVEKTPEVNEPEMVIAYSYSFDAKLILSSDEVKDRYFTIIDAINSYKKVKTSKSFKRIRVYSGRKTYAQLVFAGKTLCLAMNLNYEEVKDKYHVIDVSDKKKFAETPVLIKITSNRKVKQTLQLLDILFEGFERVEVKTSKVKISKLGLKALINRGLVKSRLTKKRF